MASAYAPERWALLSPRLDELLELDAAARAERLADCRTTDPALADELEALLTDADSPAARRFLEGQAVAGLTPQQHAAGQRCGAWTLMRPIGAGGMGSVWLAERGDGRYEGRAAVKLPHPALLARGGAERFEREGRLLARLAHPHIAALLDAGVAEGGQPYLVLEFVQGEPITRWCDTRRAGVDQRVALLLDVLDAVAHAQRQLVLHRDLKPANILVDGDGRVKLLDFGIAKLIERDGAPGDEPATTQAVFTPDHAAPEQLQGEPVGTGTDVYALGVLLYELLSGNHPTAEAKHTPVQRLQAVVEKEPLPMSEAAARGGADNAAARAAPNAMRLARRLRGDLDTIAAKALKKDPGARYAHAAALADDLRRWRDGEPVLARPDSARYRLSRFVLRHRLGVAASAGAMALLLAGVAATAWQAHQARMERDAARWQAERAFARGNLFNLVLGRMGGLDEPLTQRRVLESALEMIELHHAAQPKLAVELLLPIAGQFQSLGDVKGDLAVMQRAAQLAAASGSPELIAQVACSTVDTRIALGDPQAAAALVQQGEAAIATMANPPSWLKVSCWTGKAMAAWNLEQIDVARGAAEKAVEELDNAEGRRGNMFPLALGLLAGLRRDSGDVPGAFAAAERVLQVARDTGQAGSLDMRARQRSVALLLLEAGEVLAAQRQLDELLAAWRADPAAAPPRLLLPLATVHLMLGDAAAAETVAAAAQAGSQRLGTREFDREIHFVRAQAARIAGRLTQARQEMQGFDSLAHSQAHLALHTPDSERALLRLAEGEPRAALQLVEAELQRLQDKGGRRLGPRADAWCTAARIALAAGQAETARQWAGAALDAAQRGARDPQSSAYVGAARLLLAQSLQALGDTPGAAAEAALAAPALARGVGPQHALHAQALGLARR